jgi:hypothetical protein
MFETSDGSSTPSQSSEKTGRSETEEDYSDSEALNEMCANLALTAGNFYPMEESAEQFVSGIDDEHLTDDRDVVVQREKKRAAGVLNTVVDAFDMLQMYGVNPKERAEQSSINAEVDWEWYNESHLSDS